jgi:hypothetical protein
MQAVMALVLVVLFAGAPACQRAETSAKVKATTNMIEWLMVRHSLTFPEVSQVLGTSAEYTVSVIVGRNAGIVIKIRKDRLQLLKSAE